VFIEYGIDIEIIPEDYTSMECSICGDIHRDGRIYRGLYVCRKTDKKINADINASLNIAKRIGYKITITRKIESYLVSRNGIKPLIPTRGLTPETQRFETPPFRAGRGHISYERSL